VFGDLAGPVLDQYIVLGSLLVAFIISMYAITKLVSKT
jgi:hypothetical protein